VIHQHVASFRTPSYAALIRFAIPVMLAAIATPLMGLVDTAVLGRLGDPAIIAAAGSGSTIFTVVYWCFSFLRYTTTALVAQALGRHADREADLAGMRPMIAAIAGGAALWAIQEPMGLAALRLLAPPAPVTLLACAYVLGLHWGIVGAAWATVTSEVCMSLAATAQMLRIVPLRRWRTAFGRSFVAAPWRRLFAANLDIVIRTLLLTGAFALMTERGARLGTLALAANQILMLLFLLVANLLDGIAIAAEVFGARAIGAGSRIALVEIVRRSLRLSLVWGLVLARGPAVGLHLGVSLGRRIHGCRPYPHAAQHDARERVDLCADPVRFRCALGQSRCLGRSRRAHGGARNRIVAWMAGSAGLGRRGE
jgi:MATE family multidrug resistance protein